jgi:hypothetical protein
MNDPDNAKGDLLRRLEENGFDFSAEQIVDFFSVYAREAAADQIARMYLADHKAGDRLTNIETARMMKGAWSERSPNKCMSLMKRSPSSNRNLQNGDPRLRGTWTGGESFSQNTINPGDELFKHPQHQVSPDSRQEATWACSPPSPVSRPNLFRASGQVRSLQRASFRHATTLATD